MISIHVRPLSNLNLNGRTQSTEDILTERLREGLGTILRGGGGTFHGRFSPSTGRRRKMTNNRAPGERERSELRVLTSRIRQASARGGSIGARGGFTGVVESKTKCCVIRATANGEYRQYLLAVARWEIAARAFALSRECTWQEEKRARERAFTLMKTNR